jgi:hypothetical protein
MKKVMLGLVILAVLLAGCAAGGSTSGDTSAWHLTVVTPAGTKTYTLDQLKAMPQTEVEFLSKETGTNNKYKGPSLKSLLTTAGADMASVQSVDVEAEDAFLATFTPDMITDDVIVAVTMDGGTLPSEMGTVRVLAPGQGTKYQVKYVKTITAK